MEKKHKDTIRRNRSKFVEDMDTEGGLTDFLIQEGIFNETTRQELALPNLTQTKRNGDFISKLLQKSKRAFDVFYKGLVKTEQYHLADLLKPELAPSEPPAQQAAAGPTSGIAQPATGDSGSRFDRQVSKPVQPLDATDTRLNIDAIKDGEWLPKDTLEINVIPTRRDMLKWIQDQSENFKMTAMLRGRAIIINNETFEGKLDKRTGTNVDANNIQALFEQLHFKVVLHRNKKAHQIKGILAEEKDNKFHKSADCFVLIVLSHGKGDAVYGTDEKLVTYKELYIEFDGNNCSSLRGKPKLFFLQACQGNQLERSLGASDGMPSELVQVEKQMRKLDIAGAGGDRMDANLVDKKVTGKQDILIAAATFPGFISFRNENNGSWFIRAICEVFQDYACEDHLLDLLMKVRNLVAKREHKMGHRQTTSETGTLTKKIYFCP